MAFEELNAQTVLMDQLSVQASALKTMVLTSQLLSDARYEMARQTIEEAAGMLSRAQFEIASVPRTD